MAARLVGGIQAAWTPAADCGRMTDKPVVTYPLTSSSEIDGPCDWQRPASFGGSTLFRYPDQLAPE
jgi:hypothetical protein